MKVEAIVACGGSGSRLKRKVAKPLVSLGGIPLFIRTIKALNSTRLIGKIILVVKKDELARFARMIKSYHLNNIKAIIPGGKTRSQSVRNGLSALDKQTDLVVIHDGVRPFVDKDSIARVIKAAGKFGAAILAVPAKATIKEVDNLTLRAKKTLDRKKLWEVQTPQAFKKELILKAYRGFKGSTTDDAALVERLKKPVKVVMGSYNNIKITTPEDLLFAKLILRKA
ncbi:MAG: 2-C-methyl-D-erythritol 4-phosphate cytidylyltransferase [Candidatus Omnitrophota bacterium]|nr:2-C-methyl-D-erythritol 4-phosphate cytidylyltransferase [Candidatus Omnitrophota bacterium]